jgi:hypothetical protein
LRLYVYAIDGRLIESIPGAGNQIHLPSLPAGTYLVKAGNEGGFSVQKLIILPHR